MRLTYIYHSGFAIEADEFAILIDYYKDTGRSPEKGFVHEKLLNRAGTLYVLSSHFHPDHFNPEVLRWKTYKKGIVYLFGKDILKRNRAGKEDAIYLKKGDFYEDHNLRIKAFGSTDSGISFLIEAEGKRLFHAGDLNNWHWKDESTPEEAAEAEQNYLKELDDLAKATDKLDATMFSGRSAYRDRLHARCTTVCRSYQNQYLCTDAFLGSSGGGGCFQTLRGIAWLPVCD